MKILLVSLLAAAFAGKILAADASAEFTAANKLYAEGKFAEAAAAYEKILQTGRQSPALWFNDANAEFKAGHLGKAIAAYRRAELLAPRDADIRANLDFVRKQVHGPLIRESRWREWLGALTLNEWTSLTAVAFWLTMLALAARQIQPALAPRLRRATVLLAALTVFSGVALGVQAEGHFSRETAVVVTAEATARSGPFEEAQTVFTARDGAELPVLDRHADWVQVVDGAGQIGWLNLQQLEIVPAA